MNARNNTRIGLVVAGMSLLAAWTAPATVLPYTPDANTVALWHFNGTATDDAGMRADSSGNGHTIDANGVDPLGYSATPALLNAWDDVGGFGSFVHDIPSPPTYVAGGTDWTVELLVNVQGHTSSEEGDRMLYFDNGPVQFQARQDGFFNAKLAGVNQFSTASQVNEGTWLHVAFTYDADLGLLKIYKNGTDVTGSANPSIPMNQALGGTIRLSRGAGGLNAWYDEIRISNTIRTFAPFDPEASPVPEPTMLTLLAVGGLLLWRRPRRSNQ